MASHLPIPQPPRTPSPISDDDRPPFLLNESAMESSASLAPFDPNSLSPSKLSSRTVSFSSTTSLSPSMADLYPPTSGDENKQQPNPFGYETQTYSASRPASIKSNMGQRRGHRYKHSSVSHQIILEPTPRAPLRLPASLPIPTVKEGWHSMSQEQKLRTGWGFCHLCVAAYVQWTAQGSLAVTALSHLIFYDAIGALLSAGVEVLSNFEAWSRSSIRHPFGLQRCQVVVGFAMSILLMFMGFDLLSHNAGHALEEVGDHTAHHAHDHADRLSDGSIHMASALAIGSTLVSALMLKNHARIARTMRFGSISLLPSILNSPSHLLTISYSVALLSMPLVSAHIYTWLDRGLSTAIVCLMCALGVQLVKTLGSMLLMSYNGIHSNELSSILQDIETDPNVKGVDEARFWQVHYGLAMANLKIRARGTDDTLRKIRERVQSLVRQRLGSPYGSGEGLVWEVSTQLTLERD